MVQFEKYDLEPKEYISETLKKISNLCSNLWKADIIPLLKYNFGSYKIHDKIHLPRYIFF